MHWFKIRKLNVCTVYYDSGSIEIFWGANIYYLAEWCHMFCLLNLINMLYAATSVFYSKQAKHTKNTRDCANRMGHILSMFALSMYNQYKDQMLRKWFDYLFGNLRSLEMILCHSNYICAGEETYRRSYCLNSYGSWSNVILYQIVCCGTTNWNATVSFESSHVQKGLLLLYLPNVTHNFLYAQPFNVFRHAQ